MLVSELPLEILTNIAAFSPKETKLQCTMVCKSWQMAFQDSLLDTIKLTENNIPGMAVLSKMTNLARFFRKNGHRVRTLIIHMDSFLSVNQLETLQEYFNGIKSLCIQHKTLHWHEPASRFGWKGWRSLTHLEIEISKLNHGRRMDKTFEILSCLPNLTSLYMIDNERSPQYKFTWRTMDFLHGCLPRLETLQAKIPLVNIPVHQINQIGNVLPAETMTSVHLSLTNSSLGWAYYSNLKYPNLHTLGLLTKSQVGETGEEKMLTFGLSQEDDAVDSDYENDSENDNDSDTFYWNDYEDEDTSDDTEDEEIPEETPEDTLEEATKIFSVLPRFFPCLKKLYMNKNLMSERENDLFWKLIRQFGVPIKYLNHISCSPLMDISSAEKTIVDCVQGFSPTIETLYYKVYTNPMKSRLNISTPPMLVYHYFCLTDLNIQLCTEDMALDIILDHCPALRILIMCVDQLTLCESATYNSVPHGLERLELCGVKARTSVFNYLSVRCKYLTNMALKNARIFGPICQETGNLCLDMPYTRFDTLILGNVRFYSESDLGLEEYRYKDRMLHLITVKQVESARTKTNSPNTLLRVQSTPKIDQLWFLYFKDKARPGECFVLQTLNRSQARLIQDYFRMFKLINQHPCDNKGKKHSKDEPEEDCYWADHPPQGYATVRCGYIAKYCGKSIFDSEFITCN
ncbi:hypothetical protein CLU79DRAFT_731836 [Phycomyces nitens]|nr:hypothetical protein CLU79DRAFT_731836 [Phycomyces nitens]